MNYKINLAKIVGTPSATAWVQAVTLPGFFALLSLHKTATETIEDQESSLQALGKQLIGVLEEKVQQKEVKGLDSLKEILKALLQTTPGETSLSIVAGEIQGSALYLSLAGNCEALLIRDGHCGSILGHRSTESSPVATSSGILQNGDVVVLATEQFNVLIPHSELTRILKEGTFDEASENIALAVHGQDEGALAGALLLHCQIPMHAMVQGNDEVVVPKASLLDRAQDFLPKVSFPTISLKVFTSRKILAAGGALLLLCVLVASIIFGLRHNEETSKEAAFTLVFAQATKKYEEGTSLLSINPELAREPLQAAKTLLEEGQAGNETDEKKKEELGSKITEALHQAFKIYAFENPQVFFDLSIIRNTMEGSDLALVDNKLSILDEKNDVVYTLLLTNKSYTPVGSFENARMLAPNDRGVYLLTEKGITDEKKIVVKKEDIENVDVLAGFGSNLYAVDTVDSKIFKLVPSDGGFTKREYLVRGVTGDFSDTVDAAIDGSIYLLFADGTMSKYLEGREDAFFFSGLDTPLKDPTHVWASPEGEFVYVLDAGNNRVVVLKKNGSYEAQYSWEGIKDVQDFAVFEKKLLLLSGKKLYSIDLK